MARRGRLGEEAKLSVFEEGSVIVVDGKQGVITGRCAEDRSSGITTVSFIDKHSNINQKDYIWDYEDPLVIYCGKGCIKATILKET